MKLYGAAMPAPNPRRVRIFLAEKGVEIPEVRLEIMRREHKSPEHRARNPMGQVPTLELDDGTTISETVAICRYIEAEHPEPGMFGRTAKDVALADMWTRRVEIALGQPVSYYWRHAHPRTAAVVIPQYKDFGQSNVERYAEAQRWFDGQLEGRDFIAGDFGIADICALTIVDFAAWIGLPLDPANTRLSAWHDRVAARPSASA